MLLNIATLHITTALRAWARKLGIISLIAQGQEILEKITGNNTYELAFNNAMLQAIKPGDVVWDVGANLGLYTRKFSVMVGNQGIVHAFEPVDTCFSALKAACATLQNTCFHNLALGDQKKTLSMYLSNNSLGATHSFVNTSHSEKNKINEISIAPGDYLIEKENVNCPNIIKIDVEGYEEEVLQGLKKTLAKPECRAVFCEIHFSMLCKKGQKHAPARILKFLKTFEFSVKWVDRSHIAAYKK